MLALIVSCRIATHSLVMGYTMVSVSVVDRSARCNRIQSWHVSSCAKVAALLQDRDRVRTVKQLTRCDSAHELGHELFCIMVRGAILLSY